MEPVDVFKSDAAALDDAVEGFFGDMDRKTRLLLEQLIEIAQQRAAAREHHAAFSDIGAEFRGRLFESGLHGAHDLVQRLVKVRGTPSERLRPFTSISFASELGKAEPISILISSAVGSPISMPKLRRT